MTKEAVQNRLGFWVTVANLANVVLYFAPCFCILLIGFTLFQICII